MLGKSLFSLGVYRSRHLYGLLMLQRETQVSFSVQFLSHGFTFLNRDFMYVVMEKKKSMDTSDWDF